jgi:TolA-binding protein
LFIIAQAKEGIAAGKNDPAAWRDAALAFMRLPANFKDQTDNPHVPEALLRTAAILERLNQPGDALGLYQQTVKDYKGSAVADEAQKAVDRLQAAAGQAGDHGGN